MSASGQTIAALPRGGVLAPRPKRPRDPQRAGGALPFILPVQLLVGTVIFLPGLYIVWLSFYSSTFGQSPVFVGLGNYAGVLSDRHFWHAMLNTVVVVLIVVHVEVALGLCVALLFASGVPASRYMLAAVLAPYAVSEISAVIMWRYMLDPDIGPLTHALGAIGLPPVTWSVVPWEALGVVALMSIWLNLPFTFIILYTARIGLPVDFYEAASIDGATRWQMFRHMTLPLLMPAILIALLFRFIFAFRIFTEVWLLTQGGPARSTELVAIYLYQEAFRYNEFGIASATGWLMALVALLLSSAYLRRLYREIGAHV